MSLDDSYELIHIDHVSIIQIWVETRVGNYVVGQFFYCKLMVSLLDVCPKHS